MSLECGDCERDLRGGVHDQECHWAMHLDTGMAAACDPYGDVIENPKRTTSDGDVTCVVCKQMVRLTVVTQ